VAGAVAMDAASTAASPAVGTAAVRPRELPAAGVGARALIDLLLGQDVAGLAEPDLLGLVAGWEQVAAIAAAAQADVVGELLARRKADSSYPADDLACALSTTRHAAHALVGRADGIASHPVLGDALRAGLLDARKVDLLLDEVARLPREDADAVLRASIGEADGLTGPLLRRTTRRLVAAIDPDAARKRAVTARSERCVRLDWAADSMAWVSALLPAADAVAAFSVIDTLADAAASADDDRTVAQRRADAFSDIFCAIVATGHTPAGLRLPQRQGTAPGVHLTVAASTLAGEDDLPGELAGYGAIPAALARDLATQAQRYRTALIDPDGHLVALAHRTAPIRSAPTHAAEPPTRTPAGTPTGPPPPDANDPAPTSPAEPEPGYRPGAQLRRFVVARDQTCVFPGCRQPASSCDLDHIDPYDGERSAVEQTIAANLQPLCRHHHRTKTHRGWRMHRDPNTGDVHATSPDGITYTRPATQILLTKNVYERSIGPDGRPSGHAPAGARPERDEPPPF